MTNFDADLAGRIETAGDLGRVRVLARMLRVRLLANIPGWARAQQLRAAFLAGVVAGAVPDVTSAELRRSVHIALGETGALPSIRDARKNRPIGDRRYADITPWGLSLFHWRTDLDAAATPEARRLAAANVTADMMPRRSAPVLVRLLRATAPPTTWNAEERVRSGLDPDGALQRRLADEIMVEVDRVRTASLTPIGPDIELAPLGDRSP